LKRKWIIAGAVVLAAAGALPWGVGYLTETQWRQAVTEVNDAQPFLQLETEQYDRGILGARVRLTAIVTLPETHEQRRLEFLGDVSHGMTGSLMVLEPATGWAPEGADWFPEEPPRLTLESRVWGTARLALAIPETRIRDDNSGEVLTTSAGEAWLEARDAGSQLDMFMALPRLALTGPDAEVTVAGIEMDQSMEHLLGDLWLGGGAFRIENVSVRPGAGAPVVLSGLAILSDSEAHDDRSRLDSSLTVTLSELTLPQGSYGPHHVEFVLHDLEVHSWNRFSNALTGLQNLALTDGDPDVEAQARVMQELMASFQDVAAAGFSLGFPRVSLATPEGEVRAEAEVHHPELTPDERAAMLLVMQRLSGNLDLSLPLALAEEYPALRMQLAPLIKQGLLVQEGDRLTLAATLADLVVTVNGEAFPLPPVL
jgi:uncharacterized protein YdgA (DUF945 family)